MEDFLRCKGDVNVLPSAHSLALHMDHPLLKGKKCLPSSTAPFSSSGDSGRSSMAQTSSLPVDHLRLVCRALRSVEGDKGPPAGGDCGEPVEGWPRPRPVTLICKGRRGEEGTRLGVTGVLRDGGMS